MLNWAFHLRELQLQHVVVCLDSESEDIAVSNGIPHITVQNKTTSEDVRNDHETFRAMVSRKVSYCLLMTVWECVMRFGGNMEGVLIFAPTGTNCMRPQPV
jgi:hypothetical protein